MRVPIVRCTEGQYAGRYLATLDFEATPPGFEDCFEDSWFYRFFQHSQAIGEFGLPDLTALTGNPNAQLARLSIREHTRICFNLLLCNATSRFIQMEIRPYGPFSQQLKEVLDSGVQGYLVFRTLSTEIDDEMVVSKILGADFTTNP